MYITYHKLVNNLVYYIFNGDIPLFQNDLSSRIVATGSSIGRRRNQPLLRKDGFRMDKACTPGNHDFGCRAMWTNRADVFPVACPACPHLFTLSPHFSVKGCWDLRDALRRNNKFYSKSRAAILILTFSA